jgi:hypothetical protein
MLALTFDAILDFVDERSRHFRLLECEVSSHDAYGTPHDLFGEFFAIIVATLHELLGSDGSRKMDTAWRRLLTVFDGVAAEQG